MAFITDYDLLNNASGTWAYSNWEAIDNDSSATLPNYIEGTTCKFWALSKGITGGYTSVAGNSVNISSAKSILVGWFAQTFADIDNIPVTLLQMRISSASALGGNYHYWDILEQLNSPKNSPVSGHVPIMGHQDSGTVPGTAPSYTSIPYFGYYGNTGGTADGKQGWFDFIFGISYIGEVSATYSSSDFFDQLYAEAYDSDGSAWPVTGRPLGVFSKAGGFYNSNVSIQFGSGSGDTALTVVEEAKTVLFNNIAATHDVGYVFVTPATGSLSVTLTDVGHSWGIKQTSSAAEIFTNPGNAATFKITGCSFSGGGDISLPADSATRWVRTTKFTNCNDGTASDGEFTDCILSTCGAMTVSGDADFSGTQVLTPSVAADGAGIIWNGAYDPDGNLDGGYFSKGTNSHHAIEFGTATPTTMTLTDVDFSGFTNTIASTAAPLHIKRTTGTVTITLDGCSGITADGYKSAGATVSILVGAVTVQATITDATGAKIENARVFVMASDGAGPFPFEDTVTIVNSGTTATVTHTAHGMASNDYVYIDGGSLSANKGVFQITYISTSSYSYTMASTPGSSPTGTITSTFVALYGLTNASGVASTSRVYGSNQNVSGWARKSSSSPYYKEGPLSGTVDSTTGASLNGVLVLDE